MPTTEQLIAVFNNRYYADQLNEECVDEVYTKECFGMRHPWITVFLGVLGWAAVGGLIDHIR